MWELISTILIVGLTLWIVWSVFFDSYRGY